MHSGFNLARLIKEGDSCMENDLDLVLSEKDDFPEYGQDCKVHDKWGLYA